MAGRIVPDRDFGAAIAILAATLFSSSLPPTAASAKTTRRGGRRVLSPSVANKLSAALRDVVESVTGRSAGIRRTDVAGETGSTDNHRDAWFVGFTPDPCSSVSMRYADWQRHC